MCGACGRTVVDDPTLGPVRTTRDMMIVAQLLNGFAIVVPGRMVVRVAGDAWTLSGATGTTRRLDTVEQMWEEILERAADTPQRRSALRQELTLRLQAASPLAERVLRSGLAVLESELLTDEK